jgi:formate hydrogenlyase subunit 5
VKADPETWSAEDELVPLGAVALPAPAGERYLRVQVSGLAAAVRALAAQGARPVTMYRDGDDLAVALALRGRLVVLRSPFGATALGDWLPGFRWPERELLERAGLEAPATLTSPDANRIDARVTGPDVFALPYGPVRSGVFEAIQFMIETGGEDIPRIETRPFFKHRGLEQRMLGFDVDTATFVAERIAGIASVAYATAYAEAVERALGIEPPPRAQRWRAVYAELERIANHLDVIANEAETAALSVGTARFLIHKENVLRLQAAFTGSRFARGAIVPGGVREDGRVELDALLSVLDAFDADLQHDRRLFLATGSQTDRLIGTGQLPRNLIEDFGAVGPLARGSGVSTDARHERPYGEYRRLGLEVVTAEAGDAMARIEVRFGEIAESVRILRQAIDHLRRRDGELRVPIPSGSGAAHGWAEAPQGELVVWIQVDCGRVADVHFATPDLRNWALFEHAFPNDVLTDFAFIEHSFGLTPAGADR